RRSWSATARSCSCDWRNSLAEPDDLGALAWGTELSPGPVFRNDPRNVADTGGVTDTSSGVAIVVWRRNPRLEVLLLHRSMFGQSFAGDWAWTTPGGAREPGETAATTAACELFEETGLR